MNARYRDSKFWQHVAEKFHERLKSDPILRVHFRGRTPGEAEMININIFRAGFGEDSMYYEEAIREAHRDLGITPDQVSRFMTILKSLLLESEVDEDEAKLMISRISVWGNIITQINNY